MSTARHDDYPSRQTSSPSIVERRDPVVYTSIDSPEGPLTTEQLEFFDHNGYVFLPAFFNEEETARYQANAQRLQMESPVQDDKVISEPDSGIVRSVFYVHEDEPAFVALSRHPRLVNIAKQLLGSDVYIHQSRINFKPGFDGKEFYWHSDFETWHVEDGMPRMRAVSCSIALTQNNEYNGPLMVVPRSHRRYVTCVGETPDDHYKTSLKKQEIGAPDNESLKKLVDWGGGIDSSKGPAGSVVLFDCNTMHGSGGNLSPWPRSNVFLVYNSVENALVEPFGPAKPRPVFLGSRDFTPLTITQPE